MRRGWLASLLALGLAAPAHAAARAAEWRIPVEVKKLSNGLTVVVSEDHTSPTFGVSIVYGIGFRLEPRGRTGFAHLFEHLMFEGTPAAPKGVMDSVIEGGGGVLNGSTRYDYTNYIASAPVSALDPILWIEADRMRTLDFSEKNLANQRDVVKEEIRVNVKNRPYGLFFWTDLAAKAFDKWENAHDGYGSFADLDAATLADVESFFHTYYVPNNAVLAITGDLAPAEVFAKAEKYFGSVPSHSTPKPPDVSEGLNTAERTVEETDPLAKVPAIAVGWKMPARGSLDHVPAAVLAQILVGGEASRFYQGLVKGKELLLQVQGGLNWPLGTPWNFGGPTLTTIFALYKPTTTARAVVDAMEGEIQKVVTVGVAPEELARTKTKMRSDFYAGLEPLISRADALALAQLITGSAASLNEIPGQIQAVTAADVQRAARTYFKVANRSVVDRRPVAPPAPQKETR
jgi:predicted Zn-dependent peptidase